MLTGGMEGDGRHRVHVRLCNVLDDNGDIEVPCSNRLIVRSRYEAAVLVDEGNRVDRPKMLIVLLRYLARVHVILRRRLHLTPFRRTETHLNDFLIRHTSKEDVLFVFVRMETHDVRNLPVAEALDALACLRIP